MFTYHHVLMDGWSLPIVLREVLLAYAGLVQNRPVALPRPAPYRDYIAWLSRQDRHAADLVLRGLGAEGAEGTE